MGETEAIHDICVRLSVQFEDLLKATNGVLAAMRALRELPDRTYDPDPQMAVLCRQILEPRCTSVT